MTKCTSQQLLETVHKVTTMPNEHININCTQRILPIHQVYGVCVAAVRCVSLRSSVLRIINAKLTMLSAGLTPPHRLTFNNHYTSQDSIGFKVILSLSCSRAFCLARNASSRAFFVVALGFARCMLALVHFSDGARSIVKDIAPILSIEGCLLGQILSVSLITYN